MGEVFPAALSALRSLESADALHESLIPEAALFHVSDSLSVSMQANPAGQHSVAISLLRGCLEALTLVDLGLQPNEYRIPILREWNDTKRSAGQIRKNLEQDVWPNYGSGLWDEPWTQFFGNLARALHPYTHYSPDLMGWQMSTVHMNDQGKGVMMIAPSSYDPLKATRITFLHTLMLWTVGHLAVINARDTCPAGLPETLESLRGELGRSGLLFREGDWGVELMPHVWFKEGIDWRENA